MRKYTFFKICVVALLGLVLALCAAPAQAYETSWCPKGSRCQPVMEAWCRQNAQVLKDCAKKYTYSAVSCNNVNCCISGKEKKMPLFLRAVLEKNKHQADCWLCGLLEVIFVRGDVLATRLYKTMRNSMLAILGVVTALTLLWFAFRVFVDFSGKESRAFIQKSSGLFARVAVVALLLVQAPNVIGELFFTPLISLSTGLGLEMLSVSLGGQDASHGHIVYLTQNLNNEDLAMGCTRYGQAFWDKHPDMIFPKPVCNMLIGLIQVMAVELRTPSAFASALLDYSVDDLKWGFVPRWAFLFSGLGVLVAFFFLRVLLPFKVIDILIQLIVAACFAPLAITLFAFPATRKYTQAMWKLFLACIIQLLMLSLMVALAINLFVGGGVGSNIGNMLPLFLSNDLKAAYSEFLIDGNGMITTLGMAFVSYYLVKRAPSFAKQLGVMVNLELGDTVESATMSASAKVAGTAAGAAKTGVTTLWNKLTGSH